jgi:serine/threonine-protein kinase
MVLAELKQPDEAAAAFAQAMDLIPESRSDWYWTNPHPFGIGEALGPYDDIFARVVRIRPKDWNLLLARVNHLGRSGRSREAVEMTARLVELDPNQQYPWYVLAALKLHAGDVEGYRLACREMLSRFGATTNPNVARRTCYALTNSPIAAADLPKVAGLLAVDTNQVNGFSLVARDILDFREGHQAKAIAALNMDLARFGPRSPQTAYGHFVLAMAHQHLGHRDDARRELDAGIGWLAQNTPSFDRGEKLPYGGWGDHLRAEIFRREAESLVLHPSSIPADSFAR